MIGAAPTVLTLETDSAWMVIFAVSFATLIGVLLARRLLARPGGIASSALLITPLLLPLVAGLIYQRGLLPEISVMRPFGSALFDRSEQLFHLLMVNDGNAMVPYAIYGSAGPWILLFGLSVVSFMLIRRAVGMFMVRRLISRCVRIDDPDLVRRVERLSREAGLYYVPEVLLLPERITGAFAAGFRRGVILISSDLLEAFEPEELQGILAHEIAHLQSRDVPVVFAAGLLRDLVAWNPLAHVALRRLVRDREFEADRRAAALTGDPLSVASGLLKIVELARDKRSLGQKAVLAFWRPGYGISRRVNDLIAVADGRASVATMGKMPFVAAAMLVGVLGLQVAERVVGENPGAYAIVWGDPSPIEGDFYEVPKRLAKANWPARGATVSTRSKSKVDLALPVRNLGKSPELAPGLRLNPGDVEEWMFAVERRIQVQTFATLRWEARQSWTAEPIFSGPIGFYRFENQQI